MQVVIGREAELAALASLLDAVPRGSAALLLTGELGIGKTAVWREGLQLAEERGFTILASRPAEIETQLPYAGLGDLLEGMPEADLAVLPAAQRHAIEVGLLRAEPDNSGYTRRAIAVGLLGVLGHLAARAPVLVAVDDAQWLDAATSDALRFVARRVSAEPIGFLVATRSIQSNRDPLGVYRALAEDRVTRLDVGALPAADVDRLLRARLGVAFPTSTLRSVCEMSGGNPFFALEIGRALLRQGSSASIGGGLPVPDSLRELVLERLYRLPGTARDVLLVVAALSRPTLGLLRAATGGGPKFDAAFNRALDAGVVELEGDRVRFSHPLLGSALYADVGAVVRRRLHRRLASLVTEADEQARHLSLGTVGPDENVAAALEVAAKRTRTRGAPDAAAVLAEQSRAFTPPDRVDDAARRTLEAGDSYLEAGLSARAAELLEPLVTSLAPGRMKALALLSLGRVRMMDSGLRAAEPLLQQAAEIAGKDAALQGSIGRDLATALTQTGDLRRALPCARQALRWAERAKMDPLIADALVQNAMVEFLLGRGIRRDLLERATLISTSEGSAPGDTGAFVPADLVWGAILKWSDQFDLARERFEKVRREAVAMGDETPWVSLFFQWGELELWAGDWDLAGRLAGDAMSAAERRHPAMQREHAYLRAAIAAHQGELATARAIAGEAVAQAETTGDLRFLIRSHAVIGFMDLSAGDSAGAVVQLDRAFQLFDDAGYGDPGVIRFLPDLIEALVLQGDLRRAWALQESLADRGRTLDRPYALAAAARCRAILEASSGRISEALSALDEALEHHTRLPQPFELGRTHLVQGTLLRRGKAKRGARAALMSSLSIFEGLGAQQWAARCRSELARISGRGPAVSGLTATEARVAGLAAQGYGNREIAQALFVSTKTVEAHLTRIYEKLDVRTRGELARRSRTGGIPDFATGPEP